MDEVLKYMEEHRDEMLADIRSLVESDSPSLDKERMDLCGERIQELLQRHFGRRADVIPEEQYGDHLKFEYGEGEEALLLLSHFDTVWDPGELEYRTDGDLAYGPGILDMKGGLVQAIWALKAVRDLGLPLSKKVVHLFTSEEELSSPVSREVIRRVAEGSSCVLVTEPPVVGTGALKTARKGSARYTIRFGGKSAHAGNSHSEGASAIRAAARATEYLESLTDYEKGTTLNVGLIQGGGKLNVVSDQAEIGVDVRAVTVGEQERIDRTIKGLKPFLEGTTLEVSGGISRPPMERTEATAALFGLAKEAAGELGFELDEASVGGGSDGNLTAAMGIPTLDGLGAVGVGIHARNEQIVISELPKRAALMAKLLTRV
ncbi:M20 family metallopeptidase [Edaphobacillus lindanitolerans]|uniref:Glutamate carboxypeptidase n=1 Tax=Edaphobacillus lindanitolerans TaxID=550447 RepID=A0A1U7PN27_9BACI|nr:M20 family metallopeptidase [Edaphobacillus lindanitolerans]SIT73335.1 glutamate carboxypeptidase [Edaphobacillus lindanitolerans]